jgi:membrane-associated phospholipid phosphatase
MYPISYTNSLIFPQKTYVYVNWKYQFYNLQSSPLSLHEYFLCTFKILLYLLVLMLSNNSPPRGTFLCSSTLESWELVWLRLTVLVYAVNITVSLCVQFSHFVQRTQFPSSHPLFLALCVVVFRNHFLISSAFSLRHIICLCSISLLQIFLIVLVALYCQVKHIHEKSIELC